MLTQATNRTLIAPSSASVGGQLPAGFEDTPETKQMIQEAESTAKASKQAMHRIVVSTRTHTTLSNGAGNVILLIHRLSSIFTREKRKYT